MADHTYGWDLLGFQFFETRVGGSPGEPNGVSSSMEFYLDDGYPGNGTYLTLDGIEALDMDAQGMYASAIRWGGVMESLTECLKRVETAKSALEESWGGSAPLRVKESFGQVEERLAVVIELLEYPTALFGCLGRALMEFQQQCVKIPYTLTYFGAYGKFVYTFGHDSSPEGNWKWSEESHSSNLWGVARR